MTDADGQYRLRGLQVFCDFIHFIIMFHHSIHTQIFFGCGCRILVCIQTRII